MSVRLLCALLALGALPSHVMAQDSTVVTGRNDRMLAVGAVSAATWTQVIGMPEQWPRTWRGYGYRVSDQVGFIASEELLRYGLVKAVPWRSISCGPSAGTAGSGGWSRIKRATSCGVSGIFVAQNTAGARRPNLPVLGAILGATALSLAWRPERADARKGQLFLLTRAGIVTGATVVSGVVREWRGR